MWYLARACHQQLHVLRLLNDHWHDLRRKEKKKKTTTTTTKNSYFNLMPCGRSGILWDSSQKENNNVMKIKTATLRRCSPATLKRNTSKQYMAGTRSGKKVAGSTGTWTRFLGLRPKRRINRARLKWTISHHLYSCITLSEPFTLCSFPNQQFFEITC